MKKKKTDKKKLKHLLKKTEWLEEQISFLWERAEKQRKIGFESALIQNRFNSVKTSASINDLKNNHDIENIFQDFAVVSSDKPYLKYLFKVPEYLEIFPNIITPPQEQFIMV